MLIVIISFTILRNHLFVGCKFVKVTNTAIDTLHARIIPNCINGSIWATEYWDMRRNKSGYWHNEDDVKYYTKLEQNGSILVSYYLHFFT